MDAASEASNQNRLVIMKARSAGRLLPIAIISALLLFVPSANAYRYRVYAPRMYRLQDEMQRNVRDSSELLHQNFYFSSKNAVGSNGSPVKLMNWFYEQRMRRAKATCSAADINKPDVQQAVFSMVMDSDKNSWPVGLKSGNEMAPEQKSAGICSKWSPDMAGSGNAGTIEISPDMPIEMRAFCGFQYEENVNDRRLPKTIREVKCLCNEPRNKIVADRFPDLRCEPLYYDVPVLMFDSSCAKYEQTTEKIALACVPVLTSQSLSSIQVTVGPGHKTPVEV
ncbi:interleukin-17 domain-containing protein [Ditylenchus destructor]|nr:interleukin-17 domain-containing protein [Ditylenchus destructor]